MRSDLPTAKSLAQYARERKARQIFEKCQEAAKDGRFSMSFRGKIDKPTLNLLRTQGLSVEITGAKHTLSWG